MKVKRLRPAHDAAGMAHHYPQPHDHRRYGNDHRVRVEITIAFGRTMMFGGGSVADLSCGNGEIATAFDPDAVLGDYAAGYPIQGPIEATIHSIDTVHGFVLSETLEHLDQPEAVLRLIRTKADRLLLTTPIGCWDDDNPEHYWAWDQDFVEYLAQLAGWKVDGFCALDEAPLGGPYTFGIWVMS